MTLILSGTDGLSDVDGSAATPAIRGTDANTGIFFPAADTIAFSEGGVESMRINSSGNVGVGTATPSNSAKLDVAGSIISTAGTLSTFNANNSGFDFIAASKIGRFFATSTDTTGGVMTFTTGQNGSYTERMRIDSSGNVGIGTSSPVTQMHLYKASGTVTYTTQSGSNYGYFGNDGNYIYLATNVGATGVKFRVSMAAPDNSATIDSSGNLSVGSSPGAYNTNTKLSLISSADATVGNPQFAIQGASSSYYIVMFIDGTAAYIGQNSNSRALRMFSGSAATAGVNLAVGGTSWGTYSDERIKTNLVPIENAIQKVSTLRTVTGRYTTDEESVSRAFLIAQDVQAVLPEAVDIGTDEDKTLFLKYTETIPLLVAAIKEQQAIIVTMREELDVLKAKVGA